MSRPTVRDVVWSVRSKNAGPFALTFDLFFPDEETFDAVLSAEVFSPELVSKKYAIDVEDVAVHYFRPALAVKISIPREMPCGTPGDRDMFGGQQFSPLLDISVPEGIASA
jgi:Domain of unknown function (DUF4387)